MKECILYCDCSHAGTIPQATRRAVLAALGASGRPFVATADLCGLAARRAGELRKLASGGAVKVAACHPRAVRWLLDFAGVAGAADAEVANLRTEAPDDVVRRLLGEPPAGSAVVNPPAPEGDWTPWFPVIDRQRCNDCKQCLSFCPFGVYECSSDGRVTVAHPQSCKNNCPACARICPRSAILFPKSPDERISGAGVEGDAPARGAVAALDAKISHGDLHAILAERRSRLRAALAERGSCDCDCDCKKAVQERDDCLKEAKADGQADTP